VERRWLLGSTRLQQMQATVRQNTTYEPSNNPNDAPPGVSEVDWCRWWNLFAPHVEWTIGRVGNIMEPNPDIETLTVSARVYADGDCGVPITQWVQLKGFSWAEDCQPQRWLASMLSTSMVCTLYRVCRLMRQRQNHGLAPALNVGLFKYRNYKGVGAIGCVQHGK
jgi:hypothetical protein